MKCLVLAAGYATRLYPLTENFPKPLLKVGDKTILDWLLTDIASSSAIGEYIIISNHKFAHHFEKWAGEHDLAITVVDDGTDTNETRLGAVCDIQYAIKQLGIDDDVLIIAGDNVLDFSLTKFIDYAKSHDTSCTMRYYEPDIKRLRKTGVSEVDDNEILVSMEEKPENPSSNWCTPPFYYYRAEDIKRIDDALTDGCGIDAPGSLAAWMCKHAIVHSMEMPGKRYDIGNLESYQEVCRTYHGISK